MMNLPTPSKERMILVNQVLTEDKDPDVLTDIEMSWLENHMMGKFIEQLSTHNPMVFYGVEEPMMN
jgi:hypothetical protein